MRNYTEKFWCNDRSNVVHKIVQKMSFCVGRSEC